MTEESASSLDKLVRMANQIAAFFASYPDEQAATALAEHINLNWSRPMRTRFLDAFDAQHPTFHPLVSLAFGRIRRPAASDGPDAR